MLILTNISKKIGSKTILENINLTIAPQSIHIFLGSSGVGKSTLLRMLCGLETYDAGKVELDAKTLDLTNNTHNTFGMVFQHFNLFKHLTVMNNISFPLQKIRNYSKEKADACALELLKKYSLNDQAESSINNLSGGQKQRLAIARTIALKPQILCMDEPTSALDPLLTSYVASTIEDLSREGFTVLIATHDTFLIDKLPCTIHLMRQGKIVQTADSKAYKTNPENYKTLDSFIKGH